MRTVYITPQQAIAAYHAKTITFEYLKEVMDNAGCYLGLTAFPHQFDYEWQAGILTAVARPIEGASGWDAAVWDAAWRPSNNEIFSAQWRNIADPVTLNTWLQYNGVSHSQWGKLIEQLAIGTPSPGTILSLASSSLLDPIVRAALGADAELDLYGDTYPWLRAAGLQVSYMNAPNGVRYARDMARDLWALHWSIPSMGQFHDLSFRLRPSRLAMWRTLFPTVSAITPEQMAFAERANNVLPGMREQLNVLAYNLPSRRDLTRMLQLGSMKRADAIEGFQDLGYTPFHASQLADLAVAGVPDKVPAGTLVKWMHAGSITQAQLSARLVARGWRQADVDMLVENSYKTLTTGEVLKLFRADLMSRAEATKRLTQDGWDANDIPLLLLPPTKEVGTSQIIKWYVHDYITTSDATSRLIGLGYLLPDITIMLREALDDQARALTKDSVASIRAAYETGAIDAGMAQILIANTGATAAQATLIMQRINTEIHVDIVKKTISTIRGMFLSGRINIDQAVAKLTTAGVAPPVIQRYRNFWLLEFERRYKEIGAQQTTNLLVRGLINEAEANVRLVNLGYQAVDAAVLLAAGQQDKQKAAAAAAAKASRTVAEQQRAAKKLIDAQDKAHRQAVADLTRHGSPAQLAKWFKAGIINEAQFRRRLVALDWPANDINNYVDQIHGTK